MGDPHGNPNEQDIYGSINMQRWLKKRQMLMDWGDG